MVVLALAALACGEDQGDGGSVNSCRGDGDCAEGAVCHTELGLCAVEGVAAGREYYVKVISPLGMNIPAQMFAVVLDQDGEVHQPLEIFLPADTVIQEVRTSDSDERIRARVLFEEHLASAPTGLTRVWGGTAVENRRFYLEGLLPGASRYRIKLMPEGVWAEDYPARYYDDMEVTASGGLFDGDGVKRSDLEVDPAYVYVTGTVIRGAQLVDNVEVIARDPTSGRTVSTRATTGCGGDEICGEFTIGLAAGVTVFSLEINRPGEPWYPAVTISDLSIEDALAAQGTASPIDLGQIPLSSPLGALAKYEARVQAPVVLGDGSTVLDGVAGCRVVFESPDIAGGHAVRHAKTDSAGYLEGSAGSRGVDLFPGEYEMTIVPPGPINDALADYAVFTADAPLQIGETSQEDVQPFTLEQRSVFTGRVLAGTSRLQSGVVRAEPTGDALAVTRVNTASIGGEGTFAVAVDKGPYWVIAEAPPGSGYAFGAVQIDAAEACPEDRCALDIPLSVPFVAGAKLVLKESTSDPGTGLEGAVVEWYEAEEAHPELFHLVGRVGSDAEGRVTALLPPEVQSVEHPP